MNAAPLTQAPPDPIQIGSRRYLGSKTRLVDRLRGLIASQLGPIASFADPFGGTGVVASTFNAADIPTVAGDILYANHLMQKAFLSSDAEDIEALSARLEILAGLPPKAGYVTRTFGGAYFTRGTAASIDASREAIAQWRGAGEIDAYGEAFLVTALLYAADRIANTCGHYDAFRRAPPERDGLSLRPPAVDPLANAGNHLFHGDANALVKALSVDVLYLDPPYNSRQYSDTYHVLENLARWEKPKVFGVARKMNRRHIKSAYCRRQATHALADLVAHADCRAILLSYNNMGTRGNVRSQAQIPDEDIWAILKGRGPTEVHAFDFPSFSAGLADHDEDHAERVFLCRVNTPPTPQPRTLRLPGAPLER